MPNVRPQAKQRRKSSPKESKSRPGRSRRIASVIALLPCLWLTQSALSQQTDLVTDIASSTNDTLENAGKFLAARARGLEPRFAPFDLSADYVLLALPLTYNSNPALVNSGATRSLHFDPRIQARAATRFDQGDLAFTVSADLDRYRDLSSANSNGVLSVGKLRFSNLAPNQAVTPYLVQQLSIRMSQTPTDIATISNDLGGGTSVALPKWTSGNADWTSGLDVSATRRFVTHGSNSTSVAVKMAFGYNDHELFDASFNPSLRVRWFDTSSIGSRRDTTVILPAQAGWYPDALCNFWDGLSGSIQFSVNATRNFSNVTARAAKQWDVGPMIELVSFWGGTTHGCPT